MKILFCSVPFRPSVGGIESVSSILAEQFHRHGHEVTLVTQTPGAADGPEPYAVVRHPDARRLWALVRDADIVFHNNVSLRLGWPLLLLRRPWVVAHHTWIPREGAAGRLKRLLLRAAANVSVSRAVADELPVPSTVLPNPYRHGLFRPLPGVARERDIVFLGRLVSDKGVDVLLQALALMGERGLHPSVTVVGDGPEAEALHAKSRRLGQGRQVRFAGSVGGEALVRLLHGHRLLVVPSLWEEPFGLVVLEGLACGLVPVVARSGGLPEAAGPCGRVFPKGDAAALAQMLGELLVDPQAQRDLLLPAAEHLARHRPETVAARYLELFADACRVSSPALAG